MVTASSLRSQSSKDLAQLAKSKGVAGWHAMRKEQLIRAILKSVNHAAKTSKSRHGKRKVLKSMPPRSSPPCNYGIAKKLRQDRDEQENLKNLALVNDLQRSTTQPKQDRIIAIVRDPYWIQAYWEITPPTIERVRVAMSDHWFETQPVLRLLEVVSNNLTSTENVIREIPIHGGVRNWYLDVSDPPKTYRLALGYASANGKFFLIGKSNRVTTPVPDFDAYENHWMDIFHDYKKFYAMSGGYTGLDGLEPEPDLQAVFEEKMRRPMNIPAFVRMGSGFCFGDNNFEFDVEAYLVIQGTAHPLANVTLAGEPVKLRDDGSFSVRLEFPDKRQVLPIVASSRDGTQQRTTILAIERNTKIMEPINKDLEEV